MKMTQWEGPDSPKTNNLTDTFEDVYKLLLKVRP